MSANGKPIGRPPGARNKRSLDLARFIEAVYGGMTPGQQSAAVSMVTPKEMKAARGDVTLALATKAATLALLLGCTNLEAWVLLAKERMELIAYVHQKQPMAKESDAKAPATVFLVPEGDASAALAELPDADPEAFEIVEDLPQPADEVGRSKSDDDT
ncbi:MAG: hypothetical protein ACREEW_06225 [Caulobacteraceae bacterium]